MKNLNLMKIIGVMLIVATTSGCVTMRTNLTTFHGANHNERGSITVLPVSESEKNSLAFKSHSEALMRKLIGAGYVATDNSSASQYVAFMTYGIDTGKTTTSVVPLYGQTGGGTSMTTGNISNNFGRTYNFNSTTTQMPTYGVVGAMPVKRTEYLRELNIDIYKMSEKPTKTYEIRAKSIGSCGNINAVVPAMIESVFKNFPGVSGKPISVEVEAKGIDC